MKEFDKPKFDIIISSPNFEFLIPVKNKKPMKAFDMQTRYTVATAITRSLILKSF